MTDAPITRHRLRHRAGSILLPSSLRQALRTEFGRAFTAPYETPIVVAINGALMCSSWFLLPPKLEDLLFSVHGPIAFVAVLAAWMYSDVPATNLLGADSARVIEAIDDEQMLKRMITAKNLVLWILITPLCAVIALLTALVKHDLLAGVYAIIWIVVVPFGALGVSAWVGILFPYHPMPLKVRWGLRRHWWQMLGRWMTLILVPYVLVPAIAAALMIPSLLVWGFTSPNGLSKHLPDQDLGLGVAIACVIAGICWFGGHRIGIA